MNYPKKENIYNFYLTKNLKPCGYTPEQITAGLGTPKISNITFTLVVEICIINCTGKYSFFHIKQNIEDIYKASTKLGYEPICGYHAEMGLPTSINKTPNGQVN